MNKETILNNLKDNIQDYCENFLNPSFDPNNPIVRLHEPTLHTDEIYSAMETILSTYTTMGKQVRQFENDYAAYTGLDHAVMSNSGSSANLLSVAALANPVTKDFLKPGDEVIVPALSWSTTIWPLIQHQLTPVLVDCDINSFNLDLNKLEHAITPKTRAIKLVHVYGNPCPMDDIMNMAKKHNLIVIEDCCEAMGATYAGKSVGSFGNVGNFSFFFSHHISTLEGGISVTNDFDLTETMRILRAHGWSREADEHAKYVQQYPEIDPRFIFINIGYNLRPTEVNAAIGHHQLPKLNQYIAARREAAHYFQQQLAKYDEFFQFQQETPNGQHVWFGFPLILKENAPFDVKAITSFLQQHHIETRPIIAGNMARHPALNMFKHKVAGDLSAADTIMKKGFAFACHHAVNQPARDYIIQVIETFMKHHLSACSSHYMKKEEV